ncbi:ABC-type transport auxiliary lipoprotein family protein [Aurantiacibacter zhengii]|uniref:ABC transporter n=1 Tax=Aurantiacibacter zhengii TaxID=2307003 RepID=A0A418NVQ9_9SPHN|nr:ABC-type transport auxiliary lipoprotein family protein [Aurantiacibacter zhengii]RIV88089.1 ABC transporter [Aurantiacibacter zhengii]
MMKSKFLAVLASFAALSGCISLGGGEVPDQLLTLTPSATIPAGAAAEGQAAAGLAVQVPSVTQRLNVTRVPVTTSDSSLAYLQDAVWVEKPAQLFRNVLAETIRAKGNRLVVGGGELEYAAQTQLSGQLVDMGYDANSGSVIVRYDAVLRLPDGTLRTRRFEEAVPALPEATDVGSALNQAANTVADQVAEWVG